MSYRLEEQTEQSIPLRYVCQLYPPVDFDGLKDDDVLTFLPMDKVKSGYFLPNSDTFSKYASSYNAFEEGDILLAKVTPCFENGNIAIAENLQSGKGFGSSELFVIRPTNINRKYLFYYFQSLTFKQEGEASMTGAGGLKRVSPELLRQYHVPLLSLEQQYTIANYLDRETAHIDTLIAEKERMLALLDEKRAALISQAVTRGLDPDAPLKPSGLDWLGDIPVHWETIRLGYLVTLQGGMTPSKDKDEYWEGNVPWASPKDIKQHSLDDTIDHVSELAVKETGLSLITPPVLLLVVRGMILTKSVPTTITTAPVTINQDMKALHVDQHKVKIAYLKLLFDGLQQVLLTLIEESAHGTRCFRTDLLKTFVLPIPPLHEQRQIVKAIEEEQRNGNLLASDLEDSIALLKERRSALITAAVTGQIGPKEMAA